MQAIAKYLQRAVFVTAFLALFFATPAIRAEDANYGQSVANITLDSKLAATDAKQVILRAVAARRLELRESTDGKIVAYHAKGQNTLTLTFEYDGKHIEIFAVGSARGGGMPVRWIENVKKDINTFLVQQLALKG